MKMLVIEAAVSRANGKYRHDRSLPRFTIDCNQLGIIIPSNVGEFADFVPTPQILSIVKDIVDPFNVCDGILLTGCFYFEHSEK